MKKWEWERLRDGYREQYDRAIAEGRYEDAADFDAAFKWAVGQVKACNRRMYEEMRLMATSKISAI